MPVEKCPKGYHTATPYLIVKNGSAAIDFYKRALGATELMHVPGPGGSVMHAEVKIGDSPIMLADEFPDMGFLSPQSLGGSPVSILLYVEDVDTRVEQAVAAGATVVQPLENKFYGDRAATVKDPFGHVWTISTHVEDVPPEEIDRRLAAMMEQGKA